LVGDIQKIMQVFYNILNNSIRLSDSRGVIRVEISGNETENGNFSLSAIIKDHGRHIPQHRLKEMLTGQNLTQIRIESDAANDEKMHEIGISIVSKLMKVLEGKFEISSKDGMGTTYKIEIPLKIARVTRVRNNELPENPIRILLVEDHFLNQIATKKVLTTWSNLITVDIAENGYIGVEKFREHGYDIILMDLQMPVMNGLDATRKIREESQVPIVALTANSSRLEMEKCFEVGMNDYLAKPFKPQELFSKILNLTMVD
jgi:CheY-like chemotaxis protein